MNSQDQRVYNNKNKLRLAILVGLSVAAYYALFNENKEEMTLDKKQEINIPKVENNKTEPESSLLQKCGQSRFEP